MSCEYKEPDHSILYVMVFITMIGSCSNGNTGRQREIIEKLAVVEQKIEKLEKPILGNISGAH